MLTKVQIRIHIENIIRRAERDARIAKAILDSKDGGLLVHRDIENGTFK